MDYRHLFRPLLSYGAHIAAAMPDRRGAPFAPEATRAGLHTLLAATLPYRRTTNAQAFDTARFGVCAWLEELLATACDSDAQGCLSLPLTASGPCRKPGQTFIGTLEQLLSEAEEEGFDERDERLSVVGVYATCLDLGYGKTLPEAEKKIAEQLYRRCRSILSRAEKRRATESRYIPPPAMARRTARPRGILLWLAPIACTIALYFFYRLLLGVMAAAIV